MTGRYICTHRVDGTIIHDFVVEGVPYGENETQICYRSKVIEEMISDKIPLVGDGYIRRTAQYKCSDVVASDTHYSIRCTVIDERLS